MAITFDKVNRLLVVGISASSATIQELINAIRDYEEQPPNMEIASIATAAGKDDLGGGLLVGITLKLLNWKLKFADRGGPTYILCDVSGGNLVAVDANNVSINPIEPSAFVTVTRTSSVSAAISEITGIEAKIDRIGKDLRGLL